MDLLYVLDLFGIAVFATTEALSARERDMDVFGVIVIALVTAIGGGSLRDVLLGRTPVFWIQDTTYIIIGTIFALLTAPATHFKLLPRRPLLIADAFGLAVFTVIGTQIALDNGVSSLIAIILGVMSAVAGGVIRDLLSDQIPLILRKEIYATASFCGALAYLLCQNLPVVMTFSTTIGVLTTLLLRLAAIRWGWSLPLPLTHTKH